MCWKSENFKSLPQEGPQEDDLEKKWTDLYFRPREKMENLDDLDLENEDLENCDFNNSTGTLQQLIDGVFNLFLK